MYAHVNFSVKTGAFVLVRFLRVGLQKFKTSQLSTSKWNSSSLSTSVLSGVRFKPLVIFPLHPDVFQIPSCKLYHESLRAFEHDLEYNEMATSASHVVRESTISGHFGQACVLGLDVKCICYLRVAKKT